MQTEKHVASLEDKNYKIKEANWWSKKLLMQHKVKKIMTDTFCFYK